MACYDAPLRDDLLPSAAYRCLRRQWEAKASRRAACRLRVGCLSLSARFNCEQALAQAVLDTLARGELADSLALHRQWGEAPPPTPTTSGHPHALDDCDALLASAAAPGARGGPCLRSPPCRDCCRSFACRPSPARGKRWRAPLWSPLGRSANPGRPWASRNWLNRHPGRQRPQEPIAQATGGRPLHPSRLRFSAAGNPNGEGAHEVIRQLLSPSTDRPS